MNHTRVFWLLDEVAAKTHPNNWDELTDLSYKLIDIVGNKELKHEIVDPLRSFRKLGRKLIGLPISTIIDISGWIGCGLKPLFTGAELITDFSISRIMDISSKESTTAGFIVNILPDEAKKRAGELDLSNVLIVDDVTVSGRTNRVVLDTWGIEPVQAIHAALILNTGDYPQVGGRHKKRGARIYLEGLGSRVIYGDTMISSQDEAWHLLDIFEHPNLDRVFSTALRAHNEDDAPSTYTERLRRLFLDNELESDLFPQQITGSDLVKLADEGRFVRNPVHQATERSLYCRNPLLWTYDDFWFDVDDQSLRERGNDVLTILKRFQALTSDEDNVFEARYALVRETKNLIGNEIIEGSVRKEMET